MIGCHSISIYHIWTPTLLSKLLLKVLIGAGKLFGGTIQNLWEYLTCNGLVSHPGGTVDLLARYGNLSLKHWPAKSVINNIFTVEIVKCYTLCSVDLHVMNEMNHVLVH